MKPIKLALIAHDRPAQTKKGRKKGGTNTVKNASKIIQNYNQKLKS